MWALKGHATCAHAECRKQMHKRGIDCNVVDKCGRSLICIKTQFYLVKLVWPWASVHPSVIVTRRHTVHTLSFILLSSDVRKDGRGEEEGGGRIRVEAWRDARFKRGGPRGGKWKWWVRRRWVMEKKGKGEWMWSWEDRRLFDAG